MQATNPDPGTFAHEWVDAWNRHHLEDILSHYREDVVFHSPMIMRFTDNGEGILRGKEALRVYWGRALASLPELHFELIEVLAGWRSLTLYYQGHASRVTETFRFDQDGKVSESTACYAIAP
ncbi:nuclear transport factor 2 family protein [Alloalcanivorax mobilis]|uniref:nuclear transport factor 2 family protein n=1 Tax=Alloalcanivorax mobilis TaxID=2019569 RepID=UPI000C77D9D1|nr:nuclear transport factor 2 family protein [Alloalcanivorax mobilis]